FFVSNSSFRTVRFREVSGGEVSGGLLITNEKS
ncbi:MAG: hypothetical protein ACI9G1_002107, partial [Pirellulaceae bacterium]